jgi:hypothetical protein
MGEGSMADLSIDPEQFALMTALELLRLRRDLALLAVENLHLREVLKGQYEFVKVAPRGRESHVAGTRVRLAMGAIQAGGLGIFTFMTTAPPEIDFETCAGLKDLLSDSERREWLRKAVQSEGTDRLLYATAAMYNQVGGVFGWGGVDV